MQKSLVVSVLLGILMVAAFQNCGKGTDTGNPSLTLNSGIIRVSSSISQDLCGALHACDGTVNFGNCRQAALTLAGLPAQFGGSVQTFAELPPEHPFDSAAFNGCFNEIRAINCTDPRMQDAYDDSSSTPYAGLLQLVPQGGTCPGVL